MQLVSREQVANKIIELIQADIDAPLRETDGKNRSPRIDLFNSRVGAALGSPYCAAGGWCAVDDACKALGLKNPIKPTAWSQALSKTNFTPLKYLKPAGIASLGARGDVGIFQCPSDPDHGHYVTVSEDQTKNGYPLFKTLEYNTDAHTGSRDGDGAYAMTRSCISRTKENSGKIFVCFVDVPLWLVEHNFPG